MEETDMAEPSKLNDLNKTALDSIRSMLDVNTVIGDPIETAGGITIIPVSKVSVAYASGGVDYHKKDAPAEGKANTNFGGGGGTGITMSPVGFLVIGKDGNVNMLNVNNPTSVANDPVSSVINLIERSPELIGRVKEVFAKKDEDAEEEI